MRLDEIRLGSRTLQPRRQLLVNGRREPIGKRALDILSVLAEARGEIVTKDELLDAVWPGVTVEENALQVHIVALRKALGPEADRLRTIRGVGYQLEIDGQAAGVAPGAASDVPADADSPPAGRIGPGRGWRFAWPPTGRSRLVAVLAVLALLLAGGWAILGPNVWPGTDRPIPVVVRALTASGTGDQTEVALASGITDELIVRLRRIPDLQIATAATDGGVVSDTFEQAYVIDGSIRSSGDRLRVTARLSNDSGEILWTETFDRTLIDLFEVQELIASSIASALSVPLDVGANALEHGGTNNPQAYAAYILGTAHSLDFDPSVSQRHFEQAIRLDPNFVKASASLASLYGNRLPLVSNKAEADRLLAEMDTWSAKALDANPNLWIGQIARGWYDITRKDVPAAEGKMQRAAELDPGIDPQLRVTLAQYAVTLGRNREALAISESKALIDPILEDSPQEIFFLMMNGRHHESIELYERLASDEQANLQAYVFHAYWAHVLSGDEAGAFEFVQSLNMPNMTNVAAQLPTFEQRGAWLESTAPELRRWADERFGYGGQFQIANLALIAGYKGHGRLAVNLLRVAFERPGGYALFYLWHPAIAEARKSDAFERLVTDLGFVEAWRESDDWGDFCRPVSATEITCT